MKSIKTLALTAIAASSLAACAIMPSDAGGVFLVNKTTNSGMATSATMPTRVGRACVENILGLVAIGDSSIETAKKNGGIKKVVSVDYEVDQVVVYGKRCTVVRGN